MRVYISGGITGVKDYEQRFAIAEKYLSEKYGVTCVNPVKTGKVFRAGIIHRYNREPTWNEYMQDAIKQMMSCDAIYMLDDWQKSNGARIEFIIAKKLKFVFFQKGVENEIAFCDKRRK